MNYRKLFLILLVLTAIPWSLSLRAEGCCIERGDVNLDGAVDAADVTDLSNWMFNPGGVGIPICVEAADTNASGEPIDISDLMILIDYVYRDGPAPVECE